MIQTGGHVVTGRPERKKHTLNVRRGQRLRRDDGWVVYGGIGCFVTTDAHLGAVSHANPDRDPGSRSRNIVSVRHSSCRGYLHMPCRRSIHDMHIAFVPQGQIPAGNSVNE
jgi:hypothetical protein